MWDASAGAQILHRQLSLKTYKYPTEMVSDKNQELEFNCAFVKEVHSDVSPGNFICQTLFCLMLMHDIYNAVNCSCIF